ncbi:MAG: AAA family ATPase [Leptolyngbya sp. SIO1D8]|nr:AAA family ATPase [Leptolyngbya sp. SIO1D8]
MHAVAYRIAIVGTAGCGKTTLAQQVAATLQIPHIELDALFWQPNWQEADTWEFYQRVETATRPYAWVIDGNYLRVRPLIWQRATMVIWLNYALPLIIWRVTQRTISRSLTQQELWNGCYETLQKGFFSHDSIILWAFQSYFRHARTFPIWFAKPPYQHLDIVELKFPLEADMWLSSLATSPAPIEEA